MEVIHRHINTRPQHNQFKGKRRINIRKFEPSYFLLIPFEIISCTFSSLFYLLMTFVGQLLFPGKWIQEEVLVHLLRSCHAMFSIALYIFSIKQRQCITVMQIYEKVKLLVPFQNSI